MSPSPDLPPGAPASPAISPVAPPVRPPRAPALPFDEPAVSDVFSNPLRGIDVSLASPDRVGASVAAGAVLGRLALLLLLTSVLYAIPYGCVLSLESWWKIVAFTLGSTLICLPSLFVFSSYLGQRMRLEQILVLGLTIPAVAALISVGFAPILAFLRATMNENSGQVPWRSVSDVLLGVAVLAGIVQLWRTWYAARAAAPAGLFTLVLLVWHAVFLHVLLRMGSVLHLGG
jgi:hypothetical protein